MIRYWSAALLLGPFALPAQADSAKARRAASPSMEAMAMSGVLGISMDRMGSGTAWIPEAAALPAQDGMAGAWMLRLHGFAFVQYDKQGGPRGDTQLGSLSWGMLMATHDLAGGKLQLRAMLSLDPAGVTSRGYPLLLQTGESFGGAPLFDTQHPHDFFMEVGALYDRAIAPNLGVEFYVAPSGEPALGPAAFMHRPSAMDDPVAPIGHHWQDATHISFGVVTAGVFSRHWKLEGSVFNGRDPDENRWNFDFHPLESYSARVSVNPSAQWSLTTGFGFIRSPEPADAGHSMHRVVTTIQRSTSMGGDSQWASTLLWGANAHSDRPGLLHSALLESEAVLDATNTVFGRVEFVQKDGDDLGLPSGTGRDRSYDVGSVSLGYVRELWPLRGATLGLGVRASVNLVPGALEPFYGSRTPAGVTLFLRLRPVRRRAAAADGGEMAGMDEHAMHHAGAANSDSAFAEVQARGKMVMGVDQYTSQHVFEDLPDGGRIVLVRDTADTIGTRTIREHLKTIATLFSRGDFALPGQVHDREVPGTRVMAAKRSMLSYEFVPRAGGGEVRIRTSDVEAIAAVRAFLAFQRSDHRVP
jgi:hypothetical protein